MVLTLVTKFEVWKMGLRSIGPRKGIGRGLGRGHDIGLMRIGNALMRMGNALM